MAPKRSPPPRQPPPPPSVAFSDESASGSGSEEEEEEIAHSPPPAPPKSIAPSQQKDQESEASDEDEDGEEEEDDEEEEDEKANHVIPSSATKNPPPLPPTGEESEASDEEEEEEEAEDEMPQSKPAPNQEMEAKGAKRPSAPAPPPTREESETSDKEEEEADDEMPQTKPAPNQEMEAKGAKRPSALFQRTWSTDDEIRILEALAAHRLEHGRLPQTDVLAKALTGKLDNSSCSLSELQKKVKNLQSRNTKAVKKGVPPGKDHNHRLFDLSKNVWPSDTKVVANGGAGREPDEMCELYPYLAEEVKALQKAHPGLYKREFTMIDDSTARGLDKKIKKQRRVLMGLHMRGHDLTKEVTKTLMDMAE